MVRRCCVLAVLAGGLVGGALVSSDAPKSVPDKKDWVVIRDVIENSPAFRKVADKHRVVPASVIRYKDRPAGGSEDVEYVRALHFDYDTGKTIRSTYNAAEKSVQVDELVAYPTPLAPEEVEAAKALAAAADEKARALLAAAKDGRATVSTLAPVVSDPKNKLFGKRLAIVVLTPKDRAEGSVSVRVNLTDKAVIADPAK